MKKNISFLLIIILRLSVEAQNVYTVDCSKHYQVIDNFGASDAWSFHYLGENYPVTVREKISDLLFSKDFNNQGSPKGIGLSLWRFNIGAGSMDNPNNKLSNIWRMTECFMDSTGLFDFKNKQKGQIWFLRAAKERGCEQFLGFCNSPPWFMTDNRQACNIGRDVKSLNLPTVNFTKFADFLAEVYLGIKKEYGIALDYIAPLNEPEWGWEGIGQEGTPCSVDKISEVVKAVSASFKKRNIPATILSTESGEFTYMYKKVPNGGWVDEQIAKLYGKSSPYYIGNLYGVKPLMSGHSYWTGHNEKLEQTRKDLYVSAQEHDIRLWQSELCIMSNDKEIGGGSGRDMSMLTALYVARIIHYDLTVGNVSAWQWWTAVSPEIYKDGLIFVDKEEKKGSSNVYVPKLLWTLGNFSRFIRPGAVRVKVEGFMDMDGFMVSSYLNKDNTLVTVAINYSNMDRSISLNVSNVKNTKYYITSDKAGDDLKFYGKCDLKNSQSLPAKSIVTFVSELY